MECLIGTAWADLPEKPGNFFRIQYVVPVNVCLRKNPLHSRWDFVPGEFSISIRIEGEQILTHSGEIATSPQPFLWQWRSARVG